MSETLLPHNATEQEVALDLTTARLGDVAVPVSDVWDPETCPASALPWLAWAFSVDRWDPDWSEAQKRSFVAAAVSVHRRKGTPAAVKKVVDLIFGGGDVVEAWQSDDLDPHEFKIFTTGLLQDGIDFEKLIDLIDSTKPVRSWLVSVQVGRSSSEPAYFGMFTQTGTKTGIRGRLEIAPPPENYFFGAAVQVATITQIKPRS